MFYALVVKNLARDCQVDPEDVVITFTENGDADWSFGRGRAQFLVGGLA